MIAIFLRELFFFINMGIQASLRAPQLISRILKLIIMKVSSNYYIKITRKINLLILITYYA